MKTHAMIPACVLVAITAASLLGSEPDQRVNRVAEKKGLIAFRGFLPDAGWEVTSYHDDEVVKHGFPVVLRRIGDPNPYKPEDWPHTDEDSIVVGTLLERRPAICDTSTSELVPFNEGSPATS